MLFPPSPCLVFFKIRVKTRYSQSGIIAVHINTIRNQMSFFPSNPSSLRNHALCLGRPTSLFTWIYSEWVFIRLSSTSDQPVPSPQIDEIYASIKVWVLVRWWEEARIRALSGPGTRWRWGMCRYSLGEIRKQSLNCIHLLTFHWQATCRNNWQFWCHVFQSHVCAG